MSNGKAERHVIMVEEVKQVYPRRRVLRWLIANEEAGGGILGTTDVSEREPRRYAPDEAERVANALVEAWEGRSIAARIVLVAAVSEESVPELGWV